MSNSRSSQSFDISKPDPLVESGLMQCEAYREHPVFQEHIPYKHWSNIEVLSLFCDGVSYTKRDSFFGLYVRNMRTGSEAMVFVVRA